MQECTELERDGARRLPVRCSLGNERKHACPTQHNLPHSPYSWNCSRRTEILQQPHSQPRIAWIAHRALDEHPASQGQIVQLFVRQMSSARSSHPAARVSALDMDASAHGLCFNFALRVRPERKADCRVCSDTASGVSIGGDGPVVEDPGLPRPLPGRRQTPRTKPGRGFTACLADVEWPVAITAARDLAGRRCPLARPGTCRPAATIAADFAPGADRERK